MSERGGRLTPCGLLASFLTGLAGASCDRVPAAEGEGQG